MNTYTVNKQQISDIVNRLYDCGLEWGEIANVLSLLGVSREDAESYK